MNQSASNYLNHLESKASPGEPWRGIAHHSSAHRDEREHHENKSQLHCMKSCEQHLPRREEQHVHMMRLRRRMTKHRNRRWRISTSDASSYRGKQEPDEWQ